MIHFLKNIKNKTIIETEVFNYNVFGIYLDVKSSISPKNYGEELLLFYEVEDIYKKDSYDFMQDIHELNELQNLYLSKYIDMTESEFNNVVKNKYKYVAEKYDLKYTNDKR